VDLARTSDASDVAEDWAGKTVWIELVAI
jgi:hypothetical protein